MSNSRAILISLFAALIAVFLLFSYINSREKTLLEMASPMQVIVASRDIPEGTRIESNMLEMTEVPQKFVQPGTFRDPHRIINRNINVPVLKGTQILESMFATVDVEGISSRIPANRRAFSIFVTDITAVGQLIQPGDMVDLLLTVEVGSFEEGRSISEEIITRTILENIMILAVNQTSSMRRQVISADAGQQGPGSVFSADRQMTRPEKENIRSLTLSLSPREVQILNLSQEIGTVSVSLRSSFDDGKTENLQPLSARDFLGIEKSIVPRSSPAWVEIRGSDPFSRY